MTKRKIERLTPEQEAELPRFRQTYLDIATDGARADRNALQAALRDAYAEIGKPEPRLFIFDSPAACMIAIRIFEMGADGRFKLGETLRDQLWDQLRDQLRDQLGDQLRDQLRDQLGDQLRDQLWDQLRDQLWGQLWDQLWGQLWGQLGDQLWDQLRDQLGDQLRDQLRDQLGDQLRDQLWGQLWDQLRDQLGDQLRDQLRDQLGDQLRDQSLWSPHFLWGSQDLYWIAWAKFAENIGVKFTAQQSHRLDIMDRIGRQCEWWWPFGNVVIASQRPVSVRFDEARRLHCEDGPAATYADGYSLYAWHGTRLPARWVEERATIDPTEILKERQVEIRAAGAACIGWPRMLSALDYKIIDADPEPSHGELIELKLEGLPEPGRFLKAECPRNGTIVEGVPREIGTVLAAQAWRLGLEPHEFSYPTVRT